MNNGSSEGSSGYRCCYSKVCIGIGCVAGVIISWHSWRKESLHVLNTLATIASEEQTVV